MINKNDWDYIRKNLIWALIVNLSIGFCLFIQMYYQQQEILKEIDKLKADNKAIFSEILNLYKSNYAK